MFTRYCYPYRISSSITHLTSFLYAKTTYMIFLQLIAFFACVLKLTEFALAFKLNLKFTFACDGILNMKKFVGEYFQAQTTTQIFTKQSFT